MVITNRHIESMQINNEEKKDPYESQTELNENSLKRKVSNACFSSLHAKVADIISMIK